jgi:DNA-binding transcriptional LysR family regulator
MRLRQIEVFYAVYSAGSMSKAGELLGVSQPAVSKVLRHTEDTLGYPLFERTATGLVPTQEAADLFEGAAKVFNEVNRFRVRAASAKLGDDKPLRIALAPSIGLSAGPCAIAKFAKRHEKTSIEIETYHFDEAVNALRAEQTDIAIAYQPFPREGLRIVPIATANFVCVTPNGHWTHGRRQITPRDLTGERLIYLNVDAPLGHLLSSHLENVSDMQQSQRIVVNTYYIARMLVASGAGIAIVDEYAARGTSGEDVDIYEFAQNTGFSVGAIVRENYNLSVSERAFLDDLTTELRAVSGQNIITKGYTPAAAKTLLAEKKLSSLILDEFNREEKI